ncbi:hypothetical protein HDU83_005047 [Entophlyctis luteolus]|nr:hypothetical protein HDU82_005549 [Entophlyctis luteolus]KAJ3354596.1 hypothetical protein HDU83_005047 [Entophlyctis luteolus]KAJ3388007.1 hypothetical protein HDU84_000331 [Entophlyctis sp. JEL0112]
MPAVHHGNSSSAAYNTYAHQLNFQPDNMLNKATGYATTGYAAIREVLDRYPPLKAFAYTLLAASVFPLAVFASITGSTFLGAIAAAGTCVAVFQGIVFAVAGFVLFWFLLGALAISGLVGVSAALAVFAVNMAKAANERKRV